METTTVRQNLMTVENYAPYCGNYFCRYNGPRTKWSHEHNQFKCNCGFKTEFPQEFIDKYKAKWNK